MTNFSRHATKVASDSFQGAAAAVQKPTKREDYIETNRLFISKSFLVFLLVGIVALVCLIYFVVWPFLLSRFFTAHFYQGDKDLADWSGKVIVYYDKKKTQPMYAGTLENGVLQGLGLEYDEDGLVTYDGSFVDGQHSGSGNAYEQGVLIYSGDFVAGLYEGTGVLYEDGITVYAGEFVAGLADGMGVAYTTDGVLAYKGSFSEGLYDGTGTAYYEDGERPYVGAFVEGLREGEGIEYREDGSVQYKGSFAEDVYDGSGTYYLEDDQGTIQATFVGGETDGTIQWYKDGKLWYDGSADDLTPDGYGTLYSSSGKVVYAGEMDRGTVNGLWLLTLTAEEIREAFSEATVTETEYDAGGFLIQNQELGLWVQCSYRQGEEETAAISLWLAAGEGEDGMSSLMLWTSQSAFDDWVQSAYDGEQSVLTETVTLPDELGSGEWTVDSYACDNWTVASLAASAGDRPEIVYWRADGDISGLEIDASSSSSSVQKSMDALLKKLKQVEGKGGGAISTNKGASKLVRLADSAEDAQTLVSALLSYYENTQTQTVLEESESLLQQLLTEAETLLARDSGSQDTVDALQAEIDDIDQRLAQCKANLKQAELTVKELTSKNPSGYDLSALICIFDPSKLNVSKLCNAAVNYATDLAADQYEVDADSLKTECKTAILKLEVYYSDVQSACDSWEQAEETVAALTQAYARGTADKDSLYHACCEQNEAAINVYTALVAFADQVNLLNNLCGGWLSKQIGWLSNVYPDIFEDERRQKRPQRNRKPQKKPQRNKRRLCRRQPSRRQRPRLRRMRPRPRRMRPRLRRTRPSLRTSQPPKPSRRHRASRKATPPMETAPAKPQWSEDTAKRSRERRDVKWQTILRW
ncbi:MAG: hypothetical protein LUD83_04520 [Clostridiales bacterium]|nr:hypothetical protein [Clostridiales bacterium]